MNGFAAIYKPIGPSSSDVVIKCRNALGRAIGERVKCGHMGTLDPQAEGVLLLGFGKAARLFDLFLSKSKEYRTVCAFGETTDTLDRAGKTIATTPFPETKAVIEAIPRFVGQIQQIPPAYSAVNLNGRRAYALARKGESVEIAPKTVTIDRISVVSMQTVDHRCKSIELDVTCGGGTYIRSLCRDLAQETGSAGYMASLVRTRCGNWCADECVALDGFIERPETYLIDPETVLRKNLEFYDFSGKDGELLFHTGRCFASRTYPDTFAVTLKGELYGIASFSDGAVTMKTNLWQQKN